MPLPPPVEHGTILASVIPARAVVLLALIAASLLATPDAGAETTRRVDPLKRLSLEQLLAREVVLPRAPRSGSAIFPPRSK